MMNKPTLKKVDAVQGLILNDIGELFLNEMPYSGKVYEVFKTDEFSLFLYNAVVHEHINGDSASATLMIDEKNNEKFEDFKTALSDLCKNVFVAEFDCELLGIEVHSFKISPKKLMEDLYEQKFFPEFLHDLALSSLKSDRLYEVDGFYKIECENCDNEIENAFKHILNISKKTGKTITFRTPYYTKNKFLENDWIKALSKECGELYCCFSKGENESLFGLYIKG